MRVCVCFFLTRYVIFFVRSTKKAANHLYVPCALYIFEEIKNVLFGHQQFLKQTIERQLTKETTKTQPTLTLIQRMRWISRCFFILKIFWLKTFSRLLAAQHHQIFHWNRTEPNRTALANWFGSSMYSLYISPTHFRLFFFDFFCSHSSFLFSKHSPGNDIKLEKMLPCFCFDFWRRNA